MFDRITVARALAKTTGIYPSRFDASNYFRWNFKSPYYAHPYIERYWPWKCSIMAPKYKKNGEKCLYAPYFSNIYAYANKPNNEKFGNEKGNVALWLQNNRFRLQGISI